MDTKAQRKVTAGSGRPSRMIYNHRSGVSRPLEVEILSSLLLFSRFFGFLSHKTRTTSPYVYTDTFSVRISGFTPKCQISQSLFIYKGSNVPHCVAHGRPSNDKLPVRGGPRGTHGSQWNARVLTLQAWQFTHTTHSSGVVIHVGL